jgi:hypothetical protein
VVDLLWLAATAVGKFVISLLTKSKDESSDDLAKSTGKAGANGLVKAAEGIWSAIRGDSAGMTRRALSPSSRRSPRQWTRC